jgi:hypothetical protein
VAHLVTSLRITTQKAKVKSKKIKEQNRGNKEEVDSLQEIAFIAKSLDIEPLIRSDGSCWSAETITGSYSGKHQNGIYCKEPRPQV